MPDPPCWLLRFRAGTGVGLYPALPWAPPVASWAPTLGADASAEASREPRFAYPDAVPRTGCLRMIETRLNALMVIAAQITAEI